MRCKTVENFHEVIGVRDNYKTEKKVRVPVRSTKQVWLDSHFHSCIFRSLFSQTISVIFLFLCYLWSLKLSGVRVIIPQGQSGPLNKGKSCSADSCEDGLPNRNTPCRNNFFFFQEDISDCWTRSLVYFLFFYLITILFKNQFAMSVFIFEIFIYNILAKRVVPIPLIQSCLLIV